MAVRTICSAGSSGKCWKPVAARLAARRELGVPPDLVDRVMRRLDLRSP
jgi:hypothetical protein